MSIRVWGLCLIWMSGCSTIPQPSMTLCEQAQDRSITSTQFPETTDDYLLLAECLSEPDPAIRDTFAYERFVEALRTRTPSAQTRRALTDHLASKVRSTSEDPFGVEAPFAILVLAEIARTDRIEPYMSPSERQALVEIGTTHLQSEGDYRGFDPEIGWRHSVAHAADLMLQFSLNDNLSLQSATKIRDAIETQVTPRNAHSYIFGEPRRLARPIVYLALSGHFSAEDWTAWFSRLAPAADDPSWQAPYSSLEGLANLHNTRQFASAILIWTSQTEDPNLLPLKEGATNVLASLP